MENIVITWRELLLVVALILAVYIAEMLLLMRVGGDASRKPALLGVFRKNRAEPDMRAELARLAERVVALEAQLAALHSEKAAVETTPYQKAIQLARQGRDAVRISQSCGISHGEAELIVSIHRPHGG